MERKKLPLMTIILFATNVIVYFFIESRGSSVDADFMIQMGGMYDPLVLQEHQWYRLVSHFFLHFGFSHLFNNMVSLVILGYSLEQVMGKIRFISLYFLSGILAGITSIVYNIYVGQETVSCGASGAIYGLMGALLVMLIVGNRGKLSTEVPRYLIYIFVSIYSGMQDTSIDNAAHIGGFIAGVLICFIMSRFIRMEVSYES